MSAKKEWWYADEEHEQWIGPLGLDDIDQSHARGEIDDDTLILHRSMLQVEPGLKGIPTEQGIPYKMLNRIALEFSPSVEDFMRLRDTQATTILSGPNNSGKTLLLKFLFANVAEDAYLVACNRFSTVDLLPNAQPDQDRRFAQDNFRRALYINRTNRDDNDTNLAGIITGLKNNDREKLFRLCRECLDATLTLRRSDPENDFSPFYIDIDGESVSLSSTGTSLLLTLLGLCLSSRFEVLFIDEPEIGLSPRIQSMIPRLLYDPERRTEYFPHLKRVYIATHSHLLLDKKNLSNNFTVTKLGRTCSIRQVETISDFHQLQFNMLGNDLESLFLPAAILIVEGTSDVAFLSRVFQLRMPTRRITIVPAYGDGVVNQLHILRTIFGELDKTPYRNRICVLLDKRQSVRLDRVTGLGVPKENIIVWSKNGMEYYYPRDIVAEAFCCGTQTIDTCNCEGDPIEVNGIRKTKKELAQYVAQRMTADTVLDNEVDSLLQRLTEVCE